MKKKLLAVFVSVMLVCSFGAAMTVNAGITESKPAGNGLLNAAGELNDTSFKIVETADGDGDAYTTAIGNHGLHLNGASSSEGDLFLTGAYVPKETMAKTGVKVLYQMDLYTFAAGWNDKPTAQFVFNPVGQSLGDFATGGLILNGRSQTINNVAAYQPARTASDPKVIWTPQGGEPVEIAVNGATGVTDMIWREPDITPVIAANGKATFYAEIALKSDNWVDVEIGVGVSAADGTIARSKHGTVENWGKYDATKDLYINSMFKYGMDAIVDDLRISASYTESGAAKTEQIAHYDMEDPSLIKADGTGITADNIVCKAYEYVSLSETGLTVTDPAEGSGIVTRAALATDKSLATNLELETKVALLSLADGQKVGFGFGFAGSRTLSGAHSYLYFTAASGKVMFGGEKLDAEGAATPLFQTVEVAGATVGAGAAAIPVAITGRGANAEIAVGTNAVITVEDLDLDGFFAILHKGAGSLTYRIQDNLTMTGYQFVENEEGAGAISSNFTGNYINGNKFQSHNAVAPENHLVKADTTSHDIVGLSAENGRLGFYGTSTGTRILTLKKYADFVMQFDYISLPALQRGQLVSTSRYTSCFLMFGMKEGGLPLTDPTVFSIGINEGHNMSFWGATSGLDLVGKAPKYVGNSYKVLAGGEEVTGENVDEYSIPQYGAGGYDATKPDNNVTKWVRPKTTEGQYSPYNKTTRVKLVVVNNNVALYLAEVDTQTGAMIGDYLKAVEFAADDTEGYVGIGTDSPAWFEIDNLAITPVSREKAVELGKDGALSATGIVADIAPADMAKDLEPAPLTKPVLAVDKTAKKVTWAAVSGAAGYEVTVKLDNEVVLEKTVTGTEIDLSSLTAPGTYRVTVRANPTDTENFLPSQDRIDYVLDGSGENPDPSTSAEPGTSPGPATKKGCGCGSASASAGGAVALAAVLAAVVAIKRRL